MTQALAVARYTLIEITRRRILLLIVATGIVLMAAIAIAPHVLPHNNTDKDRLIVLLTALTGVVPSAELLSAIAIGMTVINHDLDSGAVISIFAKPVSRSSYTAGKLLAGVSLLLVIAAIFTSGSLIDVALNGGGVYDVVFWAGAVLAANVVLLMLLVMALTVYLNNIIAAAIVFAFNYVASNVLVLHAMVQSNVITDAIFKGLVEVVYWVVPHELTSNLQRTILQMQLDTRELVVGGYDPLSRVPGASSNVDIVFWFGYVIAICLLLFWSVRRKQV
jgi:ABC-type transport system involved in multi-copper enzyme maturation permease subunit